MKNGYGQDNKWEKEVEGKEPGKGGVVYRETASDSFNKSGPHVGDSG